MVKETLEAEGWKPFDPKIHSEDDWNLFWKSSRFSPNELRNVKPWQRINHFEGCA
eukprot:gene2972-8183_t